MGSCPAVQTLGRQVTPGASALHGSEETSQRPPEVAPATSLSWRDTRVGAALGVLLTRGLSLWGVDVARRRLLTLGARGLAAGTGSM